MNMVRIWGAPAQYSSPGLGGFLDGCEDWLRMEGRWYAASAWCMGWACSACF